MENLEILEGKVKKFKEIHESNYAYNSMSKNFISTLSVDEQHWFWSVLFVFQEVFSDERMDSYFQGSRAADQEGNKKNKGNPNDRYNYLTFGRRKVGETQQSKPMVRLGRWSKDGIAFHIHNISRLENIRNKMQEKYGSSSFSIERKTIAEIKQWMLDFYGFCGQDILDEYKGDRRFPNTYIESENIDNEQILEDVVVKFKKDNKKNYAYDEDSEAFVENQTGWWWTVLYVIHQVFPEVDKYYLPRLKQEIRIGKKNIGEDAKAVMATLYPKEFSIRSMDGLARVRDMMQEKGIHFSTEKNSVAEITNWMKSLRDTLDKEKILSNFQGNGYMPKDYMSKGMASKITTEYSLNQILFGAPGTGKTFNTKRIAVEVINGNKERTREKINEEYNELVNAQQIVFTTFHQSLSYEDFIEGIKPETVDGNVVYDVKDGIFKALCLKANPKNTIDFEKAYDKLQQKLVDSEIIELKTPTGKVFAIALNKNGNLSLMTGNKKERQGVLTKDRILRNLNGDDIYPFWASYFKGVINYLKSEFGFNSESIEENKNYVIIIDEINRGNVSAIFGELITLLEEDKRKGNKEQIEVTLPYSNENFSVPNNVYIIGTMNTADRSVEALDTALRRRFSFVEMQPNPEILSDSKYQDVNLKKLLETINQRIEVLIDKDHQIGHSYFIGIQNLDDLKLVFKDKIIPLLEEYFYGDFGKIGLILGGKFILQEKNTAKFPKNLNYEHDFSEDKKVYRFTSSENWNESTFVSIYED